jgi:glycosyltransferase involved in cell wall biosynthesis
MSVRRIKILLLASSYPRSRADSASIFLRQFAEKLSARGIDVHVLAPSDGKTDTTLEGMVTVHRFQYRPVCLSHGLAYGSGIVANLKQNPWLWLQVPFFLMSMIFALGRLIRSEQPDVIHAHWILPQGLIAVLIKYLYKIPVVVTAHGADAFAFRGQLANSLKRFAVAKSDAWTTNTRATGEAIGLAASLPAPDIIPMGVDVEQFSGGNPTSLRGELRSDDFLVLFVGRLVEKKGCYDLLEAFSLLPNDLRARTSLWIVGQGAEYDGLHAFATRLGIRPKVRFGGAVSNHRLPDFYAAADLFVAPSIQAESGDTEGQGVVFLEAFAARRCVLSTRVGGIAEVVTDGATGLLVEPNAPRQLAAAMESLLSDAALRNRLAENGFQRVTQRYGWEKIAAAFETLYRKVEIPAKAPPDISSSVASKSAP